MMMTHELDRFLGRPDLFVREFEMRMREMLRLHQGSVEDDEVLAEAMNEASQPLCDAAEEALGGHDFRRAVQLEELSGDVEGAYEAALEGHDPRAAVESIERIIPVYRLSREGVYRDIVLDHTDIFETLLPFFSSQNILSLRQFFPGYIVAAEERASMYLDSISGHDSGRYPYWIEGGRERAVAELSATRALVERLRRLQGTRRRARKNPR